MPFTQKLLRFTFDLPAPPQGPTQAGPPLETPQQQGPTQSGEPIVTPIATNRVTVSGLRASATIHQGGGTDYGITEISIYGLTMSMTNQLSTLGLLQGSPRRNIVTVEAGDSASGLGVVYQGMIWNGFADYGSMPNNAFRIISNPGGLPALQPIPPTSINGMGDVATIMAGLAKQARLRFENNGVQAQLPYPYLPGTVGDQIKDVAEHAGINHTIDGGTVPNTLAIWPKGGVRGSVIPRPTESR
jgi:hypothetical protein